MSFWDSKAGQEAFVLVGLQIVAFFAINPFLISLADWRNTVTEEADALMHASVQTMMHLKSVVTLTFICFGLYSKLPLQIVQILASLPFLFMIFFSTTFSPGAGVPGVKALRYLFARFYLWCRVPGVLNQM